MAGVKAMMIKSASEPLSLPASEAQGGPNKE